MEQNLTYVQKLIVDGIVSNPVEILPFIGENAFFFKESSDSEPCSIQDYIVQRFIDDQGKYYSKEEIDAFKNNYHGLSKLQKESKKTYTSRYILYIKEAILNNQIHLRTSIKEFIKTFQFPLIITTNSFDIIERELNAKDNENGKACLRHPTDYTPLVYNIKNKNDRMPEYQNVVYHLFGLVDIQKGDYKEWVHDEKSLLHYLHSLNNNETCPTDLLSMLKGEAGKKPEKRVLFLGCNLPNWIFRFIWYPFNEAYPEDDKVTGYWIGADKEKLGLDDFLEDIGYLNDKVVDKILDEAIKKMKDLHSTSQIVSQNELAHNFEYDIFISYASDDKLLMQEIKGILENESNRLRVWCAETETSKGGDYWYRIQEGIEHARYFMPIITPKYLHRFLNSKRIQGRTTESGLEIETKKASQWLQNEKEHRKWCVYSLPVILLDQQYEDEVIDQTLIESYAKSAANGMPQNLYLVQMYLYSSKEDDRDTFTNKDWSLYRNINR